MPSSTLILISSILNASAKNLHGAKIVRVGDEKILLAFRKKLIEDTRVRERIVEISMARRVPVLLVIVGTLGTGEEGLFVDTWITGLVECSDAELQISILFDDTQGVLVGVEGGHENERYINTTGGIEMFYLPDSEVEECHVIFDFEGTLGTGHT
jgi:hypothetical protein